MNNKILFLICLIPLVTISQNLPKDSLFGNVKKIREKVIFLTEKENPQLMYYDDYGHSGFMGSESTIARFYSTWYSSNLCYYLNYEREFDRKRKIIKDVWFTKKDGFKRAYRYLYDEKERLISEIDSSSYSFNTTNHYFEEYGDNIDENIISEDSKHDYFSHDYIKYKNKKVIRTKKIKYNGAIDEYINQYNDNGKLLYTIYKNPNNWKKSGENSWSYGIQDTVGVTYKSLINEYDANNRLVKSKMFDLYSDKNYKNPVETTQTNYSYNENNIIKINIQNQNGYNSYYNYKYDKNNKLIEKYCCDEDISKAGIFEKYYYNEEDKIIKLIYSTESFKTKKMINYAVSYSYKYDKNKNWIEILKTVDGVLLYKWVREIEYY